MEITKYIYILSETIGREISEPAIFNSFDDAADEMKRRFLETACDLDDDDREIIQHSKHSFELYNDNDEYGILISSPDSSLTNLAYCETTNHDDADWQINKVKITFSQEDH